VTGKHIELFLVEGVPGGITTAEIAGGTGHVGSLVIHFVPGARALGTSRTCLSPGAPYGVTVST
jgi:hypothetical protein